MKIPNRLGRGVGVVVGLAATSCSSDGSGPELPVGAPVVATVGPAANVITAPVRGPLVVRFDRALDPSSVASGDIIAFGRWSGVADGTLSLSDGDQVLTFVPDRPFSAGEWVTATIPAGAVEGGNGGAPTQGYTWSFWVETASSDLTFTTANTIELRRAGEPLIQTYGAYAGDLDGDGWSDLILPNERSNDLRVMMNDGAGGYSDFTVIPIPGSDFPSPNEGADFDGDGDIDFAVGSGRGRFVAVFHGDGMGGLEHRQNLDAGQDVRSVCVLDLEADGDPDLVAASFLGEQIAVFVNDGTGAFSPAAPVDAGTGEWSCAPGDANGDGLMDLFVGTRVGLELVVLLSNGDGTFTRSHIGPAGGDPWMLSAGDMDGDGNVDVVAVNGAGGSLSVSLGDGQGGLGAVTIYEMDGFPLAVDLGDLDGDGDLDVVASDFETAEWVLFRNRGDGTLDRLPRQLTSARAASCSILHDRDNDGDLDISGIDEVGDLLILFEN
jgi:FG-GAP-like repeat/Bacterial Ig-like domain